MTEITIKEIEVAKLAVKPGEVLLVKIKNKLTQEAHQTITAVLKAAFEKAGNPVPVFLMVDGSLDAEFTIIAADSLK